MKHLVAQPHILMSAQDPYHPASSEISHEDAIGILSGNGKYNNVHSAKGKYGNIQDTIFISNPSEAQAALAHKIAEETGQDSLIESDGHSHKMIITNGPDKGSVTYGRGTTWHDQEPEDYYTTLPTGEHFTHNFDEVNQDVQKSEDLEKSKNVREQRAKVFGTDPNAPRISNKRMKMMQAIQGYAQKKYGLPLVTASGKRDASGQLKEEKGIEQQPYDVFSPEGLAEEKARQEKVKQLGLKRVDPKPDWRSGNIETQPSPDAAVHDLAHLDLAPEGVTAPEMQDLMDRKWGESQKKYGHMQQKKIQGEIQPMALENPLRRELGLPANRTTKPVTENQTALDDPNQQRFVQGKDSKGRPAFYDRQSRLMNPETRERLTQIREGSIKFNPKTGWQPSSDVNALINLRGRGMGEEAQKRARQKFSSSPQSNQDSAPTLDDLLNHQGSTEELKQKIAAFAQAQPKKLASSEEMSKSEQLRKRCWEGYKPVPGKKPYSNGSCAPIKKGNSEKPFHGYNKEKHSRTGGLSDKYREKYNRETGSNLKRPVTGKVKAGSKAAGRRKSFCARMSGVKGPTSKEGKLTPKGAALKRWKCSKSEALEKSTKDYKNMLGDVNQHKEAYDVAKKMPNSNWGTWVIRNYKANPEKFHEIKNDLNHFAGSQHIPEIANTRFEKEHDFDTGIQHLKHAEKTYNDRIGQKTNLVTPTKNTKKILDVGNGMAWYSLGVGSCSAEGKAMGHCGNVPSEQPYHEVFSLRSSHNLGGKTYHEPHLTFINDKENNVLGEMKGRANEKPNSRYHKAIADLLTQGYVPMGGGYANENNFHIDDLSPELKAHVLKHNPEAFATSSDPELSNQALKKLL